MRMFLLLAVVFGCVVLCGCSSLETNRVGAQLTIKCELELEPVVEIREESVMGTGSASSFMGIVNWGASTRAVGVAFTEKSSNLPMFTGVAELARQAAVYDACKTHKADFLVTPRYELVENNFIIFKTVECKVIGFPGVINGVVVDD